MKIENKKIFMIRILKSNTDKLTMNSYGLSI